jgi:hypothetical protein
MRSIGSRGATNLALALCALAIFHAVSLASGKIGINDGLGWDGVGYARMVTEGLSRGSADTQTRPFLPLLTRIPHALGLGIIESFTVMNYVYAFTLYLFAAMLLERYGADVPVRAVITGNLALSVATSKMYGFYPVLIDLGALAIITVAFYLAATDRRRLAGLACMFAVASREFGMAVPLYGIHRAIRQGRPWREALVYLPSLATIVGIRLAVSAGGTAERGPLALHDALANLALWGSPAFVAAFVYFTLVVFGGITVLLLLRPAWSVARFRAEPELLTFLAVIVGLTAVGNLDIWRYLMFALPVALVLIAPYCRGFDAELTRRTLIALTIVTIVTQRPFLRMYEGLYFLDWFPLYMLRDAGPMPADVVTVWAVRLASVMLLTCAVGMALRQQWRRAEQAT